MSKKRKLPTKFEDIWYRMSMREYVLVHLKDTMEPRIYDIANDTLHVPPEGYLEYDKERYIRNF